MGRHTHTHVHPGAHAYLEGGVEMRRRAELLDVVEVAAVDDGEHSEQPLEDGHRGLLEVLRVSGVWETKAAAANGGQHAHQR